MNLNNSESIYLNFIYVKNSGKINWTIICEQKTVFSFEKQKLVLP